MVPNGTEWFQIVLNGTEWGQMVLNGTKWYKDGGRQWQVVANGGKG